VEVFREDTTDDKDMIAAMARKISGYFTRAKAEKDNTHAG
jgi:hypothetical protein